MATDKNIIVSGEFKFTPTGVEVSGQPDVSSWKNAYLNLTAITKSLHWCIGDMLNYGFDNYGEEFTQVLDQYNFQTIANDKWVCGKIPYKERNGALTFEHHKIVAHLEKNERERILSVAEKDDLTTRELRNLMVEKLEPEKMPLYTKRTERFHRVLAEIYLIFEHLLESNAVENSKIVLVKKGMKNITDFLGANAEEIYKVLR